MKTKASKGACAHCGKEYTRSGMAKHLRQCLIDRLQTMQGKTGPCFHLQIAARFLPGYWLHLQADANTTLKSLDGFLRKIWLECCGHMSVFHLGPHQLGMGRKLVSTLEPGMELGYEYDMGDTTALRITVMGEYPGLLTSKKPVEVLARNLAPSVLCDACGKKPAVMICPECNYEGEGWLCNACAKKHECGDEDYFLPVVNSPRAGVCGYTG